MLEKHKLTEQFYIVDKIDKVSAVNTRLLKNHILSHFMMSNRYKDNQYWYMSEYVKVPYHQHIQWTQDYLRDHFRIEHDKTLIPKLDFGIILDKKQQSHNRNLVEPLDLLHAPDYTCVYGVDIDDEEQLEVVIHYNDNRRVNRTWHVPLHNNKFIIFPSMQRFYISENKSSKLQTILISTYEYI